MRRVRMGVLGACALAAAAPATAQGTQGWQISVDAIHILTRGNDVHVGDVFTEDQRTVDAAFSSTFDYGVTYDPIVTMMKDNLSVLVAAAYRGNRWGFGGRGWRVTTAGDAGGRAQSAAPTVTVTPTTRTLVSPVTGIRMWDHSSLPVANDSHPSGFAPVSFHAENRFEHLRIDGYAERVWITDPQLNVAMRVGVAYARLENTRAEGHAEMAILITATGSTTRTFTNAITLEAESEAEMRLFGPSFALAGDLTYRRLQIDWLVNPAIMFGGATTSGTWIDTDNITDVIVTPGARQDFTERLRGVIPIARDERAVVPVVDLQMKTSVRVARALRVGAGLFSSSWFGIPMAPAFSIPGDWTDVQGTGWRAQSRDLTFLGYSGFVTIGF